MIGLLSILILAVGIGEILTQDTIPTWKTAYIEQKLDHFNFPGHNVTFKQRYLYQDMFAKNDSPVFFYCGNEGPITSFWENSGFIFTLAQELKAHVIFAEHRYYGETLPFGNKSFAQPYIQHLTIEQAMMDFAYLLRHLKLQPKYRASSVIAFGGSYGGMLAAYMRLTYPTLVNGALAASAPVNWVAGLGDSHQFFRSVTKDFTESIPSCSSGIKSAFDRCLQLAESGEQGLASLSQALSLCHPLQDRRDLEWAFKWMRNAFVMLAMMDYPTPSNFMDKLPAYPVNASCRAFNNALSSSDGDLSLVVALREAVGVFYNNSGAAKCFDYKHQYIECSDITGCGLGNSALAWDFQSCTEMNLYDGSNSTDGLMFPALPLTLEQVKAGCIQRWGVKSSFDQLAVRFGPDVWKHASNIIFSNGDLDPWALGGILSDVSDSVLAVMIHGGAHHLDLRSPTADDPPSVNIARQLEKEKIVEWIK